MKKDQGTSSEEVDWVDLAFRLSRTKFVEQCAFPFLVVDGALARPDRPQATAAFSRVDEQALLAKTGEVPAVIDSRRAVFAIRKVQAAFASMITVGRTANNDVVVPDVTISRFHAFFRREGDGLVVGDAGSRNGTWAGKTKLEPKGPVATIRFGQPLRLGRVQMHLLDAAATWERVRRSSD